ncbi:MAG TPA: hypothetical protein VNH18_35490, partial [Bryobacteraceae bacterium]|nr:hypothetical protein [Bryobacteraceae bacterium]
MADDNAAADGGEYDLIDPGPSGFGEGIPPAASADTPPPSTETPPAEGAAPPAGTEAGQQVTDATAAGAAPSGEQPGGSQVVAPAQQLTPELMQRAALVGVDPAQLSAFADPVGAIVMAENVAMRTLISAAQFQTQQANQQRQQQAPRPQPPQPPPPFDEVAARRAYADAGYDSQQIDLQIAQLKQGQNILVGQYQLALKDHQLQESLWQSNQTTLALQAQMAQQQQAHQQDLINRDFADFKGKIDPNVAKMIGSAEQQAIMEFCHR